MGEDGSENLYRACDNQMLSSRDPLGLFVNAEPVTGMQTIQLPQNLLLSAVLAMKFPDPLDKVIVRHFGLGKGTILSLRTADYFPYPIAQLYEFKGGWSEIDEACRTCKQRKVLLRDTFEVPYNAIGHLRFEYRGQISSDGRTATIGGEIRPLGEHFDFLPKWERSRGVWNNLQNIGGLAWDYWDSSVHTFWIEFEGATKVPIYKMQCRSRGL